MKTLKTILILLLTAALGFFLFSCNEDCEHSDADKDGICDACGKTLSSDDGNGLVLIDGDEIKFQIVTGDDVKSDTLVAIDKFVTLVDKKFGIEIPVVSDKAENEIACEILVGTVKSRGDEYKYDKYSLGKEGYVIKALGEKVIISAGYDDYLDDTVQKFFSEILGITDETDALRRVSLDEKNSVEKIQDDYRIKSVTVGGESIKDYKIVVDFTQKEEARGALRDGAKMLQDFFYERAGMYLEIINAVDNGDEGAIIIRSVSKGEAGSKGFRVRLDGKNLLIECAHYNKFAEAFQSYYNKKIDFSRAEALALEKYDSEIDISKVRYSDFGAVGDGKTDDYLAIKEAHEFANAGGQTVLGDAKKTYYLNLIPTAIEIKTDVDWNGCKFIVDDSDVTATGNKNVNGINVKYDHGLFNLKQDIEDFELDNGTISKINENKDADGFVLRGLESGEPTQNIGFSLGFPAMLRIFDYSNYNYLRYGYVDAAGNYQRELVLIDKDGNIDPSTPLLHDYRNVSTIIIHRADTTPITLKNMVFESVASRVNLLGGYHSIARGISINRANVTIENIEHIITGELPRYQPVRQDENGLSVPAEGYYYSGGKIIDSTGKAYTGDDIKPFTGHSYSGLITVSNTHNTYVKNVVFQSRVLYREGTYDIGAYLTNQIVFENCTQSNFFEADGKTVNMYKCWGVAGTNYCKNMDYINCKLTRYDAHSGVTNGRIIGGELAVLRLIGGGDFTMERVKVWCYSSGAPFQLREDYGASFNGTITIKDCDLVDPSGKGEVSFSTLFSVPSSYWDMGYKTFMPNIIIDNLNIETSKSVIYLSGKGGSNLSYDANHHYPYRDIIAMDPNNPDTAGFKFHYETKNPEAWVKTNITNEGSRFFGCEYEVHKYENGTATVVVTDKKNQYIYHAPEFITIKNNSDKPYVIGIYDCPFYRAANVQGDAGCFRWIPVE